MSERKQHSPEPWSLILGRDRQVLGEPVIAIEFPSPEGQRTVALVFGPEEPADSECMANALLLRAAPRLKAALEYLVFVADNADSDAQALKQAIVEADEALQLADTI